MPKASIKSIIHRMKSDLSALKGSTVLAFLYEFATDCPVRQQLIDGQYQDVDNPHPPIGFKHAHTGQLIARQPDESEQDLVERAYDILGSGYHPLYVITKALMDRPNVPVLGASEVSSDTYKQQIGEAVSIRHKDIETLTTSI
jgi:hypothetical protein